MTDKLAKLLEPRRFCTLLPEGDDTAWVVEVQDFDSLKRAFVKAVEQRKQLIESKYGPNQPRQQAARALAILDAELEAAAEVKP